MGAEQRGSPLCLAAGGGRQEKNDESETSAAWDVPQWKQGSPEGWPAGLTGGDSLRGFACSLQWRHEVFFKEPSCRGRLEMSAMARATYGALGRYSRGRRDWCETPMRSTRQGMGAWSGAVGLQ